ncbi:hypothetical protein G6F56_009283 [Rhizopus delemar]|nr:hypothetical protein G6F56_009283 [Rhizopus delemar]
MLRKDRLHYNHERFVVELDPSRRFIKGFAELIVHPLVSNLTKTNINCRQCNIENVSVNDIRVDFTYKDVAEELNLGTNTTIAHHQVYKSKYLNALREADEGELSIDLPSNCVKQIGTRTDTSHIITKDDPAEKPPRIEPVFAPITIRIEYTLDDPQNGVVFVQKDDEIAPHVRYIA